MRFTLDCALVTSSGETKWQTVGEKDQTRSDLFRPVRLGRYQLTNRIVMAPLTRSRAGEDGKPRPLMIEYSELLRHAILSAHQSTSRRTAHKPYD